jgi:hypothetical protein
MINVQGLKRSKRMPDIKPAQGGVVSNPKDIKKSQI